MVPTIPRNESLWDSVLSTLIAKKQIRLLRRSFSSSASSLPESCSLRLPEASEQITKRVELPDMDQQGRGSQAAMGEAANVPHPAYPQLYRHQQQQQQQQQLQMFLADQYREIEQTTDFNNHSLPLARIKKIMKADEDARMIAAEAPFVFSRACEMFILDITHRSWAHAEENKRRTLQKNDIAAAITRTDMFNFLVDTMCREEKIEDLRVPQMFQMPGGDPLTHYYVQQ